MEDISNIFSRPELAAQINQLRYLAHALIGLALAANIVLWINKAWQGTLKVREDIIPTVGKMIIAVILIGSFEYLAEGAINLVNISLDTVIDTKVNKLASEALRAAFGGGGLIDKIGAYFSASTYTLLAMYWGLQAVLLIKFVIMDVLWPINMVIVSMLGITCMPIGTFPGMKSFGGWVKSFLQYCSWPVIFYLLTTILFAISADQLKKTVNLKQIWAALEEIEGLKDDLSDEMEDMYDEYKDTGKMKQSEEARNIRRDIENRQKAIMNKYNVTDKDIEGGFTLFFKICGIFIGYLVLLFNTHKFAGMIFNGDGDGMQMGGTMVAGAAMGASMVARKSRMATGAAGKMTTKGLGKAGSSLKGAYQRWRKK